MGEGGILGSVIMDDLIPVLCMKCDVGLRFNRGAPTDRMAECTLDVSCQVFKARALPGCGCMRKLVSLTEAQSSFQLRSRSSSKLYFSG